MSLHCCLGRVCFAAFGTFHPVRTSANSSMACEMAQVPTIFATSGAFSLWTLSAASGSVPLKFGQLLPNLAAFDTCVGESTIDGLLIRYHSCEPRLSLVSN